MKLTDLPPVPPSLKNDYRDLIEDVDHQVGNLSSYLHKHLRCSPGCSSCCRRFSIAPIEAALIGERVTTSMESCSDKTDDTCGFLIDNLCSIYPNRPLICRTQGLPIAYLDEINEQIDVSVCPLNFSEAYQFTHEDLLFLDPVNSLLAELNIHYCRKSGIDSNSRISLG